MSGRAGGTPRVGVFVPPPPPPGSSASVHSRGIGRIPRDAHERLFGLLEACAEFDVVSGLNFCEAIIDNNHVYLGDTCLNDLDLFFWYCEVDRRVGSFDLQVLKALSATTRVVLNPWAFELGLDKYASHLALRAAGARVADSVLFDYASLPRLRPILARWKRALLKPRRGGFGKGVVLVESYAALRDMVEYIGSVSGSNPDHGFFLERYYANDLDRWVSTTFVGQTLVYGYRKRPSKITSLGPGAYKVYDANEIGGEVDLAELEPEQRCQAQLARAALGAEIIGFDMIATAEGPVVVDENTFPGCYSDLFRQVGHDLGGLLFQLIRDEVASLVCHQDQKAKSSSSVVVPSGWPGPAIRTSPMGRAGAATT